jgi:hypothetical protein
VEESGLGCLFVLIGLAPPGLQAWLAITRRRPTGMRPVAMDTGLREPVHFFERPIAARGAHLVQTLSQESHTFLRFRVPRGRCSVELKGRLGLSSKSIARPLAQYPPQRRGRGHSLIQQEMTLRAAHEAEEEGEKATCPHAGLRDCRRELAPVMARRALCSHSPKHPGGTCVRPDGAGSTG